MAKSFTAKPTSTEAGSPLRFALDLEVHQLPDARRQEGRERWGRSTTPWTSSPRSFRTWSRRKPSPGPGKRPPEHRSPLEAGRRCDVPSSDPGRPEASADPRHPPDPRCCPRSQGRGIAFLAGRRIHGRLQAGGDRDDDFARTSTAWPTRTRRLLTSHGEPQGSPSKINRVAGTRGFSTREDLSFFAEHRSLLNECRRGVTPASRYPIQGRLSQRSYDTHRNASQHRHRAPTSMPARRRRRNGSCSHTHAIHRMGNVDDGNTTTDFDPEEAKRGITIYSAAYHLPAGRT